MLLCTCLLIVISKQVCNHPDLFEGRPIVSAFDFPGIELRLPSIVTKALEADACKDLDFRTLKLVPCQHESMAQWQATSIQVCNSPSYDIHTLLQPLVKSWNQKTIDTSLLYSVGKLCQFSCETPASKAYACILLSLILTNHVLPSML